MTRIVPLALLRTPTASPDLASPVEEARQLPLGWIEVNPGQPRRHFDPAALDELRSSIRDHGLLAPVLVRPLGASRYQLVCGERRYRAVKDLGWTRIPAIVRELGTDEAFMVALHENLKRRDLEPVEEARSFARLLDEKIVASQRHLARQLGLSHTRIQQKLRLLSLPAGIQDRVRSAASVRPDRGEITERQAREILRAPTAREQEELYRKATSGGLSARALSGLGGAGSAGGEATRRTGPAAAEAGTTDPGRFDPAVSTRLEGDRLTVRLRGSRSQWIQGLRRVLARLLDEELL